MALGQMGGKWEGLTMVILFLDDWASTMPSKTMAASSNFVQLVSSHLCNYSNKKVKHKLNRTQQTFRFLWPKLHHLVHCPRLAQLKKPSRFTPAVVDCFPVTVSIEAYLDRDTRVSHVSSS